MSGITQHDKRNKTTIVLQYHERIKWCL